MSNFGFPWQLMSPPLYPFSIHSSVLTFPFLHLSLLFWPPSPHTQTDRQTDSSSCNLLFSSPCSSSCSLMCSHCSHCPCSCLLLCPSYCIGNTNNWKQDMYLLVVVPQCCVKVRYKAIHIDIVHLYLLTAGGLPYSDWLFKVARKKMYQESQINDYWTSFIIL